MKVKIIVLFCFAISASANPTRFNSSIDFTEPSTDDIDCVVICNQGFLATNETDPTEIFLKTTSVLNSSKIVGGRNASKGEFPYMAEIGYLFNDEIILSCGGTLLNQRFVLTAAHCINSNKRGLPNYVALGSWHNNPKLDPTTQEFGVSDIIVHEEYNNATLENDIALIQLNREAEYNEYVQPILLNEEFYIETNRAQVIGWGKEKSGVSDPKNLKVADLVIQNETNCNYDHTPYNHERNICAAPQQNSEQNVCNGDSGGPLIVQSEGSEMYMQVGIVSSGDDCDKPQVPSQYVRVSYYIPWIRRVIRYM